MLCAAPGRVDRADLAGAVIGEDPTVGSPYLDRRGFFGVEVEQEVVKLTTEAQRRQEVAVIEAEQRKKVAEVELAAAEDQAQAITARGEAAAEVINFENEAEAAGWQKSVEAYGGSGDEFARWVMLKKLAPSFRQMMVNTADSPLMDIFNEFNQDSIVSNSDQRTTGAEETDQTLTSGDVR